MEQPEFTSVKINNVDEAESPQTSDCGQFTSNNITYNIEIANLGYDKYLDYFVDNEIYSQNEYISRSILRKGRHKDLDFFIKDSPDLFISTQIIYWQRKKDLIKLQKSKNKYISCDARNELNKIDLKKD